MLTQVREITAERKARNVAIAGLILQVLLALLLFILAQYSRSTATFAAARFLIGGVFLWIPLIIIYHQRKYVAVEALENEALLRERSPGTAESIFEAGAEEFLVAQRRLNWVYRWVLRFFIVLAAAYLILGFFFWPSMAASGVEAVRRPELSMLCVAPLALVAFLFSRYVAGMSREPGWRLLRSGSIYLFGNVLVMVALFVCLALVNAKVPGPERVLTQVVRYLLLVLGLEISINFILDFYRPRVAGEGMRAAFESRLLGLASEPGGLAKSIADAVNYQFGFEVSGTWFYKTLERNVVPMLVVAGVVLVGMTSLVVIDADQRGVKERFGERASSEPLGPGLHFKWPWPVERVIKANVARIQQVIIGEVQDDSSAPDEHDRDVLTWTDEHGYVPAVDVLVATPRRPGLSEPDAGDASQDVAVSILRVSMPVMYRSKRDTAGLFDYIYNYQEPEKMLRDVARRELVKQAVSFDYQRILADQRAEVADRLRGLIQQKCDELRLGLEIVYVGLTDIHPPTESDVAATYQLVATADQEKQSLIEAAWSDYDTMLVQAAGDTQRAEQIQKLIQEKGSLPIEGREGSAALDDQIRAQMLGDPGAGVVQVRGNAGERLARARATAARATNRAAAKARTFDLEKTAFEAAPRLYKMRKALKVLSGELDRIRKYVLMVDRDTTEVIIELKETEAVGLEVLDAGQ